LKHLGFSLDEIKEFLESADYSPGSVINLHISQLREHIKKQQTLCRQLEKIAESLQSQKEVTPEQFIEITEAIKSSEKYPLSRELDNAKSRDKTNAVPNGRKTNKAWEDSTVTP
jgi:DNA-binding transcriptional MerR regulator